MGRNVEKFMIDSGAFTVWTKGEVVDLDKYIEFCKEHEDCIDYIVSLDVIPPKHATKKEVDHACEEGWENYQKMLDAGLDVEKVIPVFHRMDDWKWLERFMEEEIPYFGLGGIAKTSMRDRRMWLDTCMKSICDKNGMPLTKIHGFGVTSIPMMVRYPWYSVDSTSWLKASQFGGVLIPPTKEDGSWDFFRSPMCIAFSTKAGSEGHFNSHPPLVKKKLMQYIKEIGSVLGKSSYRKEPLGYKHDADKENIYERNEDHVVVEFMDVPGISNDYRARHEANIHFFQEVENRLTWPRPFHFTKRKGLL